jgi:hypothetical protein
MSLVRQWQEIERSLPESWGLARLRVTVADAGLCDRAATLLGPANPGRRGNTIRLEVARAGGGIGPVRIRSLLQGLDREGIDTKLELVAADEAGTKPAPPPAGRPTSLVEAWDAELTSLPDDWSDLYAEIALSSTDYFERAALLTAPLNPARFEDKPILRFRAARRFGYGASAGMVRRCLERLDAAGIRGTVRSLRVLSDTEPVYTQGPVWYVGGKSV